MCVARNTGLLEKKKKNYDAQIKNIEKYRDIYQNILLDTPVYLEY